MRSQPTCYQLDLSESMAADLEGRVQNILRDDAQFSKKFRGKNFFKKLSPELLAQVKVILQPFDEFKDLIWHFEIFYSVEPTGLHNDRNYFSHLQERCERGLLIPLSWTGSTPKTKFYDLLIEQKVNWTGKAFKTLDGVVVAHPPHFLSGDSHEMEWKKNEVIFFDSRQIHEACPFGGSPDDYKLSINALGYSKHSEF